MTLDEIDSIRHDVMKAYNFNEEWCERVREMPVKQLIAIHYSLINRKNNPPKPKKPKVQESPKYEQLCFW